MTEVTNGPRPGAGDERDDRAQNLQAQYDVRRARSAAEWLRYVAGALIVGGSTVALTLLLAGTLITLEIYVVLLVLYAVLLLLIGVLGWCTLEQKSRKNSLLANRLFPGTGIFITVILVSSASDKLAWPIERYTTSWWSVFGLALFAVLLGAQNRMYAERTLEMFKTQ